MSASRLVGVKIGYYPGTLYRKLALDDTNPNTTPSYWDSAVAMNFLDDTKLIFLPLVR